MKKITILFASFISVMFGCQNSDLELASTVNLTGNEQLIPLRETFDFTYKGETYSSLYHIENDTLMILEDKKVATLYNQLLELPELATYVTPKGDIEYFDSYGDLQAKKPARTNNKALNLPPNYSIITLYEHAHYNLDQAGLYAEYRFTHELLVFSIGEYGIDEKVSSARVHSDGPGFPCCSRVTFFRNINFGAQSITFDFHDGIYDDEFSTGLDIFYNLKVNNFKKYKVKSGINWNDRISSFKILM
ncbi:MULTISPECIES: hypothetical protein [Butyricimonas]|uniref:hypothetical protein n=1 Tax=Butyricimonas TaxID=574697 RepID=UPI0007FB50D6|nr:MULTISPECIES: hypothetical protein [Butyricimonas]